MKLSFHLAQKQTMKLVMTPRLQQALKLLQMPALELSAHIKEELLTNPLLEIDEEAEDPAGGESPAESPAPESSGDAETVSPDDSLFKTQEENINWSDYFRDGYEYSDDGSFAEHEETEFFERTPVGRTTLADSLTEQLHMIELDEETLRIAEFLVGCIDDAGFVSMPIEEVAESLAVDRAAAERALAALQSLDPPGVGARNLAESLLLQLRAQGKEKSIAALIVAHHFNAFKQRQYQDIARALHVTPADVQEAARDVAALNPRPGASLALEDARYVVPDLVVEKVEGRYEVFLNEGSVPRLKVSRGYRDILAKHPTPRKSAEPSTNGAGPSSEKADAPAPKDEAVSDVEFIQEKLKSANWLIQTIEQRRRTMIKVMEAIVEAQMDFFEKGPQALRPLTLQDVAEKIGMHESTVSRVTTNKYVQTPRGVFPLKYFFSSGLDTETGDPVSSKMAMNRIQELVSQEDKKHPLSDQRIVELLRREGLIVARRTVAKYRERMGVLSARFRKEF